jgi:Autographiviridae endonuclease VII
MREYGLSIVELKYMKRRQKGRCAICGKRPTSTLNVDHCHKRNKVRALLCANCNRLLGLAYDNPKILRSAARYLEHYR